MNKKARYWTFVAYPESLTCNLVDFLSKNGLVYAISPLHDKDIDITGEPKKPHFHILLEFPGPTTYKKVKEDITEPLGQPIPTPVMTIRGAYRYLCHLDNPDKAQYNEKDIIKSDSFELVLTKSEVTTLKANILIDISKNRISEYYDLLQFYLIQGDFDRFDIVASNTIFFNTYLSSKRAKIKQEINEEKNC